MARTNGKGFFSPLVLGSMIGLASAIPGIDVLKFGPFRLWHLIILCALAGILQHLDALSRIKVHFLDFLFLLYPITYLVLEFRNSEDLEYVASVEQGVVFFFYIAAYLLSRISIYSLVDLVSWLQGFLFFIIPSAVISVLQYVSPSFGTLTLKLASGEGLERRLAGEGIMRAAGLFGHWSGAAFYFCVGIAGATVLLIISKELARTDLTRYSDLIAISGVLGVIVSQTISAVAIATILGVVYFLRRGSTGTQVALAAPLIPAVFWIASKFFSARFTEQATGGSSIAPEWLPSTLQFRWKVWTLETIPAIKERLWTGWGTEALTSTEPHRMVPSTLQWRSAENQWLFSALTGGLVLATLLWLLVLGALWASLAMKFREVAFVMSIFIAALIIASFTVPIFTNRGMPLPFWALFGAVLSGDLAYLKHHDKVNIEET